MITAEDVPEIVGVAGVVVPARSRPARATILAVVSRLVLSAAIVSGVWAVLTVREGATGSGAVQPAPAWARSVVEAPDGTTLADLLAGLETTMDRSAAWLHELEIGAPDGVRVPVSLRVELPSGGAGAVERFVRALEGPVFDDVRVRSVTPVAGGARIDIAAGATLASLGPVQDPAMTQVAAVALTDAVTRVGASLQHLEVPFEDGVPVRMEVRGDLGTLAALVRDLEARHTAPLRFVSLGLRTGADDLLEARLIFRPSVQAPSAVGGEAP